MSATGNIAAHDAGQTLIEMLVALAILTLLAGIAAPGIGHLLTRQALVEAQAALTSCVAQARADAVAHSATVQLALAPDGTRLISSAGRPDRPLPAGVSLDWPRAGVAFHGDGTASGWDGAIHTPGMARRFRIDPQRARAVFGT
jgi:prepilin-type N-terminal cleavage/methylation domain-containing protein